MLAGPPCAGSMLCSGALRWWAFDELHKSADEEGDASKDARSGDSPLAGQVISKSEEYMQGNRASSRLLGSADL